MKLKQRLKPALLFLPALAITVMMIASGCKKDPSDPPAFEYGRVAFLNAAFAKDSLNFYIGADKVNKNLLAYRDTVQYVKVLAGSRNVEFKTKDGSSVLKKSITIEKDKSYSLIVVNSTDGKTFELLQITDDLSAPAENKGRVRLLHLSPNVAKVDLSTTEDLKLAEKIAYKSASSFKDLDAKKTSFKVTDAENKSLLQELKDVQIEKGKIYSVWISGVKDTTDTRVQLKTNVFVNK